MGIHCKCTCGCESVDLMNLKLGNVLMTVLALVRLHPPLALDSERFLFLASQFFSAQGLATYKHYGD